MNSPFPDISHVVPAPRLARYHAAVSGGDEAVRELYRWAQQLSLSLFADIGTLEVAMRSAMARELSTAFGNQWYASGELFDDDAARKLATAWSQGRLGELRDDPGADLDVVEGKLVAEVMFGFWVQILGKGSYSGRAPLRRRRIYDTLLWQPALSKAFPHALNRRDVQRAAEIVRVARNRVAHHEHIAWGVPLPGQNRRLCVSEVHDTVVELAGWISAETRMWLLADSTLHQLLAKCPGDRTQLALEPPAADQGAA